jgi:phosphate transport system permease protein
MRNVFSKGDLFIWATGVFLGLSILMISGMLLLIFINGGAYFHPKPLRMLVVQDESGGAPLTLLGQVYGTEPIPPDIVHARGYSQAHGDLTRSLVRLGNREQYGSDFQWIDAPTIIHDSLPANAVVLERLENGHAFGFIDRVNVPNQPTYDNEIDGWDALQRYLPMVEDLRNNLESLQRDDAGDISRAIEDIRLRKLKLEYEQRRVTIEDATFAQQSKELAQEQSALESQYGPLQSKIDSLRDRMDGYTLELRILGPYGEQHFTIPIAKIVRAYKPNRMAWTDVALFYGSKIAEFLTANPREANAEGGVFPAIFGTVMMVLLMTIAVVPFGVLAALYLREYAKQGTFVRLIRIAVNNLAGVPSIVFGMFGLGFFVYFVGGGIDALFYPERLPTPTYGTGGILWASLTLALLTVPVVIVSTEEALAAIPRTLREGSLALGATKWETIRRVVIPTATPGILTGAILAMARGAGEVAPLMITGVVKLATNMPFDSQFPFFHMDRKFMHLGFHIYDIGFQTANVEANIGMVYTTALLLIVIVLLLNLAAIFLRARLRNKFRVIGF